MVVVFELIYIKINVACTVHVCNLYSLFEEWLLMFES